MKITQCALCNKELNADTMVIFTYGTKSWCNEAEFHQYINIEIQKKRDYEIRFAKEQEEKQQHAFKQTKTKQSGFFGKDNVHQKENEETIDDEQEQDNEVDIDDQN